MISNINLNAKLILEKVQDQISSKTEKRLLKCISLEIT